MFMAGLSQGAGFLLEAGQSLSLSLNLNLNLNLLSSSVVNIFFLLLRA
jgi:hypothetical protein